MTRRRSTARRTPARGGQQGYEPPVTRMRRDERLLDAPLDTIEYRDAILAPDSDEPDWPKADVVIVADPKGAQRPGPERDQSADPQYIHVTRTRWEAFTGQRARALPARRRATGGSDA